MQSKKKYKTIAVIDIDSSALRLYICNIFPEGDVQYLEEIEKNIDIGKDSYIRGRISIQTIKKMILILGNYAKLMQEYMVDKYRAVATSGLREAENRDYILSQVKIETGVDIEIINNSEERYLNYKAISNKISSLSTMKKEGLLIIDIGSGGLEISVFNQGSLKYTDYLKAGSLRLSEVLVDIEATTINFFQIMEEYIESKLYQLKSILKEITLKNFIVVGGEIETFLKLSKQDKKDIKYNFIKKDFIKDLYSEIMFMTTEQIAVRYSLDYNIAKKILPSLIIFNYFLELSQIEEILLPLISIKDGILAVLKEEYFKMCNNDETLKDIISSVKYIAKKYQVVKRHSEQVEFLSLKIFDQIEKNYKFKKEDRLYLQIAAILHDVGKYIDENRHALHAYNILCAEDIMGFTDRDLNIIANIVKYHEQENPKIYDENYAVMTYNDRILIAKLVAILKLANSLDISYKQKVITISIIKENKKLLFKVQSRGNLLLEKWLFTKRSKYFEDVYGYKAELILKEDILQ